MLYQCDNVVFSVPVVFGGKTPCAVNAAQTIHCESRLAMNADRPTEHVIITLIEHQ